MCFISFLIHFWLLLIFYQFFLPTFLQSLDSNFGIFTRIIYREHKNIKTFLNNQNMHGLYWWQQTEARLKAAPGGGGGGSSGRAEQVPEGSAMASRATSRSPGEHSQARPGSHQHPPGGTASRAAGWDGSRTIPNACQPSHSTSPPDISTNQTPSCSVSSQRKPQAPPYFLTLCFPQSTVLQQPCTGRAQHYHCALRLLNTA